MCPNILHPAVCGNPIGVGVTSIEPFRDCINFMLLSGVHDGLGCTIYSGQLRLTNDSQFSKPNLP